LEEPIQIWISKRKRRNYFSGSFNTKSYSNPKDLVNDIYTEYINKSNEQHIKASGIGIGAPMVIFIVVALSLHLI